MLAPLKERRLLVFGDYADTRLSLAEHNAILGELQQQAVLHPHRERIWEQLALARYRSGNVAGALDTVSEAFARLREDLGIEPGEPMRRLQLPPDPRVLTGRESGPSSCLARLAARAATSEPRHQLAAGRVRHRSRQATSARMSKIVSSSACGIRL
jgi:DNA-binding SARP family transcriptional activator